MKFLLLIFPLLIMAETKIKWEHENPGCPINSVCYTNMGKKRLKWREEFEHFKGNQAKLLEKIRQDLGIPFKVWAKSLDETDKDIIRWDSPCRNHHKRDDKIYLAEVFTKDLKELNSPKIISEQAFIIKNNKILSYPIPRKEYPIYMDGPDLIFSLFYDGVYFDLKISPGGALGFLESPAKKLELEDIACPKELTEHFAKFNTDGFYIGYFCRAIYDTKGRTFHPLLIGLSCP
ncbi:MAG: hypothetical protein E2O68_01360 [Deltaproteobacteria bacterium]|nr:MAG: hypothetical protein E2O68_01360 [Deltaproteobacteria bacterium]